MQQHRNHIYTGMFLSGKLNAHLEEVDRAANEMFERLMQQYAAREGITEQLKAQKQWKWVRRMYSIRRWVEEAISQF